MKEIKRLLALVLCFCMIFSLAACTSGSNEPAPAETTEPETTEPETADNGLNGFPKQYFQGSIIWGAGGSTDIICRGIAPYVEPLLGKSIVFTNRAGAAGGVAMEYVNSQPAEGYELLMTADNPQVAKVLGASSLDLDDFIPIDIFCESYGVLIVNAKSKYDTYDKLIEGLKTGNVTMAATGVGGLASNLNAMIMSVEKDIKPVEVVYDGEGSMVTAVLANQVDCGIVTINSVTDYIQSGDIKCIAIFANEVIDMDSTRDLPLLSDCNPEYNNYLPWANFFGVCVKKGTPQPIVDFLTDCFIKASTDPGYEELLLSMGCNPLSLTGQEAIDYIDHYKAVTSYLIYDSGYSDIDPASFGVERVN